MERTGQAVGAGKPTWTTFVVLGALILLSGCNPPQVKIEPSIEFTRIPPAGEGTANKVDPIEGRVAGTQPGQQIVLFAKAGVWWVQPLAHEPFTQIRDSRWKSTTHPGTAYAALLVDAGYFPPSTIKTLPPKGGKVRAVAVADGEMLGQSNVKVLHFSGYQWTVRQSPSEPGGSFNLYDPANASVDEKGFLHLRIVKRGNTWTSSEVQLPRGLGYGSYSFVVHDVSQFEPAAVLNISIWDTSGQPHEMNLEIGRWGEPKSKNAQYVVQPYYIPANVVRFVAPPGTLSHTFVWEPGRVSFSTARGSSPAAGSPLVAQHVFTSSIPSPGNESTRLNLYVFDNRFYPLKRETEVIIEKFEYLP